MNAENEFVYKAAGFCPICERDVMFSSKQDWFRDHLLCSGCNSIPRERALMRVIAECFPNYRELTIHESSPCYRGTSVKLSRECPNYSASHYFEKVPFGQHDSQTGYRCESLEALTYEDNSFDLFVTQDVMEHVFHPDLAFREIRRVLRPGGAHIFTVPIINKHRKTEVRARRDASGETVYLQPPEYHQNDIDQQGALVTVHWGYDIVSFISDTTGMPSTILTIDDLSQGIRAEFIDVVVSWCPEEDHG